MYKPNQILKVFIASATIIAATNVTPALAMQKSEPTEQNCNNSEYRRAHPYKCKSLATMGAVTVGGAGVVGGVVALVGLSGSSSGGGSAPAQSYSEPTARSTHSLPVYNMVGGDVDSITLANITNGAEYVQNYNQYNEIRLAYSLARGFTGAGSKIAVLDTDGWHGDTVKYFAGGQIAPDATVKKYVVADAGGEFFSYRQIGNIIASAPDANIYNASWSTEMRATAVRSRTHLAQITNSNFINQIATAAEQRDAIFVWAAGNDFSTQSSALSAMPLFMPELEGHFVNVVAWDNDTGALASYSNQCGITKNYCITAPGTSLQSPTSDAPVSGTSFAAPIVSAAIAVIRQAFPYMKSSEITALLFETARDLGEPGVDAVYGHGMLDLERATRPVGAPLVPLGENPVMQPLTTARVSGTIGHKLQSAELKLAYFDKYGRAFDTNLNDNIKIQNPGRAYGHLRADRETQSATIGNVEMGFRPSDFIFGEGFLKTSDNNIISFIGTSGQFHIGDIEFTHKAQFGSASPKTTVDSMISDFKNIYITTASLQAKYQDWSVSVGIPDTIVSGTMTLRIPTGRASNGTIVYGTYDIALADKPAIEYTIGYKSVTFGFVDNPYGTDEFYVLAKKSLRF